MPAVSLQGGVERRDGVADEVGELAAGEVGHGAAVGREPVVKEDRLAVGAHPDVGLDPVDAQVHGPVEGVEGVLGDVDVIAAVGEDLHGSGPWE